MLAGMTPPEPSILAVIVEYVLRAGPIVAAVGIWVFGIGMNRSNKRRTDAEKNRHEEAMTALAQAAEDRKAMQAQMAEAAAQAAEDRKVTQGQLAALERQGKALERQGAALERLVRHTDAAVVELKRFQGQRAGGRR